MTHSLITKRYGKGIPVIFIHGWGVNSAVWHPIIQQLAKEIEIITIDLPGFGLNLNESLSPYTLTKVVDKIQACFQEPAIIVGWSLGGLVATDLTLRYPDKVLGLVNVASSPCFLAKAETNNNDDDLHEAWPGIQPDVLKMFHQQLTQNTKKTIEGFLKIQAMGSPHVRQDIKTVRDLVMQHELPNVETLDESLALLETVDLRNQLNKIEVPTLRLYGKLDGLVPKAAIPLVSALMPSSDYHVFDKASHAPFISHTLEFNDVLLQWIKSNVS
jgi:pimeloyl-[acyl-carrier protein] methyl ester esterase